MRLHAIAILIVRVLKPISSVQCIRSLEFNVKSLAKELSYVSDVFHLREVIQKQVISFIIHSLFLITQRYLPLLFAKPLNAFQGESISFLFHTLNIYQVLLLDRTHSDFHN